MSARQGNAVKPTTETAHNQPVNGHTGRDWTPPTQPPEDGSNARCSVLQGRTYKVKNPMHPESYYLTINNDENGEPFELFINSKNVENYQYMLGLCIMVSDMLRNGRKAFVIEELGNIVDPNGGYYIHGTWYKSFLEHIAHILRMHCAETSPEHH